MKATLKYIVITLVAGSLASCHFLDEIPPSNLVSDQIFESETAAASTLEGCYQSMVSLMSSHFLNTLHGASILQHTHQTPLDSWYNHTVYSNHAHNGNTYKNVYSVIAKCNSFIDCAATSDLPKESTEKMVAQARFLRAYTYFMATRLWGDVPLVLDKVVSISQAEVGRSHYTHVYKAILDDLDYAQSFCPTPSELSTEDIRRGHVCTYSAIALKAKVYVQIASLMTSASKGIDDQWFDLTKEGRYPDFSSCGIPKDDVQKAWELALVNAENVMQNGPFDLEPDYANLFRFLPDEHPEDYLSKERILTVPVTSMLTGGSYVYASWSLPKQPYGSSELTTDNGNKLRIRPSRFTWETWCAKYGNESDLVEKEDDELGEYTYFKGCADPRLDATYFYDIYYTGNESTGKKSSNKCYPNSSRVAFSQTDDLSSINSTPSLNCNPIYKKGFSKGYQGNSSGGDADIYLFRYADVILLAAEAAANLNDKDKAVSYVNKILTRARNSTNNNSNYLHVFGENPAASPADWSASDFKDKDELILAILWERFFEMDYESQSFFDTRRYGATYYVENFVKPYNKFMHTVANYRIWQSPACLLGRDMQEDIAKVRAGLLIAYPEYEILNNSALNYSNGRNDFFIE